ncbi:MAG TPA: hypothetical protein VNT02_16265 [Burkholderiales bacterium]|nr:hypothetical protein [Burkholderiales bacterium]
MDILQSRCACRLACYTLAMASVLCAPAALQAAMLLWPDAFGVGQDAVLMACVLAAAIVAFPVLLAAMLNPDQRGLPP